MDLNIRISRDSIIKLSEHENKEVVVNINGGRKVSGALKSWDKGMNLVLDNAVEIIKG